MKPINQFKNFRRVIPFNHHMLFLDINYSIFNAGTMDPMKLSFIQKFHLKEGNDKNDQPNGTGTNITPKLIYNINKRDCQKSHFSKKCTPPHMNILLSKIWTDFKVYFGRTPTTFINKNYCHCIIQIQKKAYIYFHW